MIIILICSDFREIPRKFPGNFRDCSWKCPGKFGTFPENVLDMSANFPYHVQDMSGKFPEKLQDNSEISRNFSGNFILGFLKPPGHFQPVLRRKFCVGNRQN